MDLKFVPFDYDSLDIGGKTYVRIWGRSDERKRICVLDSCEVFFYVLAREETDMNQFAEKIRKLSLPESPRENAVKEVEMVEKKSLGKEVKALKVTMHSHKDIRTAAEAVRLFSDTLETRETDIPLITRYILEKHLRPFQWYEISGEILAKDDFFGMANEIDAEIVIAMKTMKKIEDREVKGKALAIDIEVDGFEIGKGKILMIGVASEHMKKVLTWKKTEHAGEFVEFCDDEKDMLEKFLLLIKKERPDFIVGYFSDGFDMPYLKARAEKNRVKLALSLDNSVPSVVRGRISASKLTGIVHVDLFRFIETVYAPTLQSETLGLNAVAAELLGEKKHDLHKDAWKNPYGMSEEQWNDYFKYNLQDAVLAEKLFGKLWPDLLEFTRITQEPLFEVSRDGYSQMVENYIIHNLERFNEIAVNKPYEREIESRRERKKYAGAFVLQPKAALYENLAVFDFTSLYPSLIVSFNLSPSTITDNPQNAYEIPELELEGENHQFFFSKNPGFIPTLLKEIIEKRKEIKRQLKKEFSPLLQARSNAMKTLANATYGYYGFFAARYYCLEAAASTAALGRKFIHETIEKTNKAGYAVMYADTDGFAFLLKGKTQDEAKDFLKKLNSELPGMMELELEDFYQRGIFVTKRTGEFGAKKKYALLSESGKMKIRGFETIRRDWCDLAREVQNTVLTKVLREGNAAESLKYAREVIRNLDARKVEKESLLIRTQLKKEVEDYVNESPHVTIAKKMMAKGIAVDSGMMIEYFIAEPKGKQSLIRERARLPDEEGDYDLQYYKEHQIVPAIENIFAVFNIGKDELLEGKKQKKIFEF